MRALTSNLRPLLDGLAGQSPKAAQHIEAALESSPYLMQFMSTAVDRRLVEQIRLSPPEENSGGHFDAGTRTVYINSSDFQTMRSGSTLERQLHDRIVSTLGHETSHAFRADALRKSMNTLDYHVGEGIREAGPGGHVDLTDAVRTFLDSARALEASAERAGFNALASRVETQSRGKLDTKHLVERAAPTTNCVAAGPPPSLAAGIELDSRGRIPVTPTQREAIAVCHLDDSLASLGQQGTATYRNYYAASAVERIEENTRNWANPPEIRLDMTRLGLDHVQITGAGLDFGRTGRSVSILDPATGMVTLSHNKSRSTRATPDAHIADQPINVHGADVASSGFSDQTHRDHALYRAVQQAVQTRLPDGTEISEDRLAQFTLAAKAAHFKPGGRIDALVGETGVSFHGDYPAHSIQVDLAEPVPSADESARKAADLDLQQARQSEQRANLSRPEQEHAPVMEH